MPFCIPSLADPSAGVNCFNMVLTLVFRVIMRLLSFFFKCGHPLCPSFACLPRQPRSSITKNKQKYIAPSVAKLRRSKQFKRFRRLKYPRSYRSKGYSPGKNAFNRLVHNLLELISKGYNPTDLSQQPSCNFPGKQIKILFHNLYVD